MPYDNMKFSFKKPSGAKPMADSPSEEKNESMGSDSEMTTDEMGAAVKAAMSTGGSALYEAIANIVAKCK